MSITPSLTSDAVSYSIRVFNEPEDVKPYFVETCFTIADAHRLFEEHSHNVVFSRVEFVVNIESITQIAIRDTKAIFEAISNPKIGLRIIK